MLSETFVSIILEASLTGAGLILAVYALITPISHKIFEQRVELLNKRKGKFDEMKEKVSSESSKKDLEEFNRLILEIQAIKKLPKYLGVGVLIVFFFYFITILTSFFWFIVHSPTNLAYEPSILASFFIATSGFFAVGVYTIVDVIQTLKKEYEQIKEEQESVVIRGKVSLEQIIETGMEARRPIEKTARKKKETNAEKP